MKLSNFYLFYEPVLYMKNFSASIGTSQDEEKDSVMFKNWMYPEPSKVKSEPDPGPRKHNLPHHRWAYIQ